MMVAAGAAGADVGRVAWNGSLMGIRVSAVHWPNVGGGDPWVRSPSHSSRWASSSRALTGASLAQRKDSQT